MHFSESTLAAVWLLGFTAWKIFSYHRIDFVSNLRVGQKLKFLWNQNEDERYLENEVIRELHFIVERILREKNFSTTNWSDSVLPRQVNKVGFNCEQQANFDIFMIATSFLILHEVKHVMFNNQESACPERLDEEIACDTFAKEFLLDKICDFVETRIESERNLLPEPVDVCLIYWELYSL